MEEDPLLCRPVVIGELARGSLLDQGAVLAAQRQAAVATDDEIMTMIERHRLFSMGPRKLVMLSSLIQALWIDRFECSSHAASPPH